MRAHLGQATPTRDTRPTRDAAAPRDAELPPGATAPRDATLIVTLPDPSLVVLVGAAGSGKTTFAARHFAPAEVLSSDAYRGLLAGDEAEQGVTRTAFRLLHRDLERRLAAGLTSVVDATNVTSFARRSLTRIAQRHGIPVTAIVLALEPGLVLARNATRAGRIVPEAAVRRQLAELERSLRRDDLANEGFAERHVLREPGDVDGVRIVAARVGDGRR